ncbi:MAG: DUF444 family protein [bacterium]|nr:DUF444 family protein [bacterium]
MSRLFGIQHDEEEFLKMAKRRARSDLAKYLRRGTIPANLHGKKRITIAMDWFEIPSWRYGFPKTGVGQGEGKPGDDLGPTQPDEDDGDGCKEPGATGGGPISIDVDVTPEEFEAFFQEALELPRIKPKGDRSISEEREKYNTISRVGPKSQLHEDRTFEEAMKRSIAEGLYRPPDKLVVVPHPKDFRFKSWTVIREPKNNAAVFFIRDISGSMGPEETRAARYLCGLCQWWLSRNYDGIEVRYVVHHGEGWEVDEKEFFTIRSGGGTEASSGHVEAHRLVDKHYPVADWNIYFLYLSDGFNASNDNAQYERILRDQLLPIANQYSYGEITAGRDFWGAYERSGASIFSAPGTIGKLLEEKFKDVETVALAEIKSGDDMYSSVIDAIKTYFKKGH